MATEICSCDTGKPYSECCGPALEGRTRPATAADLMRSRYTAFVRQEIDYLMKTLSPARIEDTDRAGVEEWARDTEWAGLEIIAAEKGGPQDETGQVEFKAKFREKGELKEHHELASFVRMEGAWVFDDGKAPPVKQVRHEGPRIGRNDPCPCGSGKKYKKCHGAAAG